MVFVAFSKRGIANNGSPSFPWQMPSIIDAGPSPGSSRSAVFNSVAAAR